MKPSQRTKQRMTRSILVVICSCIFFAQGQAQQERLKGVVKSPEVLTRISVGNASDEVRQRYINAFSQSSVKGMLDYYRATYSGLTAGSGQSVEMPNLTMPVLQFHGLKDKAVDKDGLRDTWNWINKDYTLVTIPSSGHWVQRDAADMVSNTMRWWLKSRH